MMQSYTNERLFVQYGFSLPGNPNDEIFLEEEELPALLPVTVSDRAGSVGGVPSPEGESKGAGEGGEGGGGGGMDTIKQRAMELLLSAADKIAKGMSSVGSVSGVAVTDGLILGADIDSRADSGLRVHATCSRLLRHLTDRKSTAGEGDGEGDVSSVSPVSLLSGLLQEVDALASEYPSSLSEDLAVLTTISSYTEALVSLTDGIISRYSGDSGDSSDSSGRGGSNGKALSSVNRFIDGRGGSEHGEDGGKGGETGTCVSLNRCQLMACVRRRVERKELLQCAQSVVKEALSMASG